jgi:signal transduction histidine kinase
VTATEGSVSQAGERPDYDVDGDTPAARVFTSGEPEIYHDLTAVDDSYDRGGLVSGMYFPIGEHGVMSMGGTTTDAFGETDQRVVGVLAKLAAEALTRVTSAAELRRKNERLDEFASIVAHDLRNPLAVASGYASEALKREELVHVERTVTALDRMDSLIGDVLTLARQGQVVADPTTIDLEGVVRRAWDGVETDGARLVVEDSLPVVDADEDRLQEVFENLFRNSSEHGFEDDRAASGGEPLTDDGLTVTVGSIEGGVFVEDDGRGIPDDERAAVLDPGYSTAADGTGYGLYIVEEIAAAHSWQVTVTEGRDGGARFDVTGMEPHRSE